MKMSLALLACCTCTIHAGIIDMTPGGFTNLSPSTPIAWHWLTKTAYHNSFPIADVIIQGDTLLWAFPESPAFSVTNQDTTAVLFWDLAPLFPTFTLHYLWVNSLSGTNLYHVTAADEISGSPSVTVDNQSTVNQIVFFGTQNVPDSGSTLFMFLTAILLCGIKATLAKPLRPSTLKVVVP